MPELVSGEFQDKPAKGAQGGKKSSSIVHVEKRRKKPHIDMGLDGMGPMNRQVPEGVVDDMVMSFFTMKESLQTTPLHLDHPNDSKKKPKSKVGGGILDGLASTFKLCC